MADYFRRALQFQGDAGELIDVQAPVGRPDPIQRPGSEPQYRAPPRRQQVSPPQAMPAPQPEAAPMSAQPDSPIAQYLQDPAAAQQLYAEFQKGERPNPAVDLRDPKVLMYLHTQVQLDREAAAAKAQPRPQAQPQPGMPAQASPPPPPQQSAGGDYFSRALRQGGEQQPSSAQPQQADPNAEPDATTWIGRQAQSIAGKTDKRFKDLPTIAEVMLKDKSHKLAPEIGSWLVGASDKDMTGVYKEMLGPRFVRDETDANGFPVVVYKDQGGREAKAYVNKPGLDMQDVVRGGIGLAPFAATGRLISGGMKGANLLSRMTAQGLGQAATSGAQDAAGVLANVSEPDLEKSAEKATVAGLGGAGGELIGHAGAAIYRKLVTEPKFFNRSTGALTQAGEDAARSAGLDPAILTREAAKDFGYSMARTGDATKATQQTLANEFNIPRTAGQLEGNTQKLLREQQMQGGAYGDSVAKGMQSFVRRQDEAITNAVRGEIEPGKLGIAGQLAPGRAGGRLNKDELGSNIRANTEAAYDAAKASETQAWKAIPDDFKASPEALDQLNVVIPKALASRGVKVVEEGLTPQAKIMSDMIEQFQAGGMPANASKFVKQDLAGHVDIMRRRLLAAMEKAADPTDKRAAKALYDGYNDWVVEAARLAGDPTLATKMVTARGLSRQIHEIFDGPQGSAGGKILANVLKNSDSAEGVVNALFSAPSKSEIKGGAVTALAHLKKAYDTHLPADAAKAAWDDIRLAYWMKTVDSKTGDVGGPKALASAIKSAIANQGTVVKALYQPQEIARMQRMATLLDDVAKRNPNTSWSGVSMGALLKDVSNALLSMIGANTILGRTAMGTAMKPFQNAYGSAQMRAATGSGQGVQAQTRRPLWAGGVGGGVGAQSQD